MLLDLQAIEHRQIDCDICIVGGGAVGLAMGVRLARADTNVVLLEAGGERLEECSQELHRGASVGHPFENMHVGRYRVLGGSTTFWGGQILEISDDVMQPRPWIEAAGWPIERQTLEPYFTEAYGLLGLANIELDDAMIWKEFGVTPELDPSLQLLITRWLPQRNFARLFRADIDKNRALKTIVHANVTGFVMDEGRRRVVEIEARNLSGRKINVKAKSFVLACGSLEIARLLLHPATNGDGLPWHANPWLGCGFIDHLHGHVADVTVLDHDAFHRLFDSFFVGRHRYYPRLRLAPLVQKAERTVDVSGEFIFDTAYKQNLDNIKSFLRSLKDGQLPKGLAKLPGHCVSVGRIAAPLMWRYLRQRRSYKPRSSRIHLSVSSEQIPMLKSRVRLGNGVDAVGSRRIVMDWQIDGREVRSIAIFARRVREALAARGLAHISIDPFLSNECSTFLTKLYDGIHQMGTARMASSPSDGVVDRDLRVHGTDNLYVAGQAVFPYSGFANPTFTGIALGLRLSDHLSRQNT